MKVSIRELKANPAHALAELPKKQFKPPVPVFFAASKDGQSLSDLAMEMRWPRLLPHGPLLRHISPDEAFCV